MEKTHKVSGWKRVSFGDGSARFHIIPTDDSGERVVSFMSAGSWGNYPQDERAKQNEDRIVLLSGSALPQWAHDWLTAANNKSCYRARENFRAAIDQADFDEMMRDGSTY
jgi:hypothetical protein